MSTQALSYAIDQQDLLVKVDQGFYRFAEENEWTEAGMALGRPLWDFVAGEDLRKVQRMLLRRIRDEGGDVELPFRCDGPDVRRKMEIRIKAGRGGRAVLFSARVRTEEEREEPQPLLDPAAARGPETLPMCGWCDRFEVGGEWVEVEEAVRRLELFDRPELPTLSHGVCPDCNDLLLAA